MGIGHHFLPLRHPTGGARDGEHHGEHGARNSQRAVNDARVEVHVRIQLARHEVLVLERDFLQFQRQLEQRIVDLAELLQHSIAHAANDLGARIEVLVDAVPESHQAHVITLVLDALEEFIDACDRADSVQHVEHGLIGAAVRGSPQSGYAGRYGGVGIRAGAAGQPHRRRAGVLFVIRVQNEQKIERFGRYRIDCIRLAWNREEHVEHVRAVAQIVSRIDERLAERVLVGRGGDGRQLRDDPMREDLPVPRVVDVGGVVIERGHRSDHGGHHGHGVRIVMETLEETQQLLVDHGVPQDRFLERIELRLTGQRAVDQKIGHLEKARLLGELLHRIAAIQQHPLLTVDERNLAFGARRGHEAGIEREDPLLLDQVGNVERLGTDGPRDGVQRTRLSGREVLEFVFRAHALFRRGWVRFV